MFGLALFAHNVATHSGLDTSQAETLVAAYEVKINDAGGTLSATQRSAAKAFIRTGLTDGWYTKLIDCGLFLGGNLDAALVKLVAAPGSGDSYTNYNLVSGDYTENGGISVTGNTDKYIGTGFAPADVSLTSDNLSFGVGTTSGTPNADYVTGQGLWGTAEPDSLTISDMFGAPFGGIGQRGDSIAWTESYSAAVTYKDGEIYAVQDGIVNGSFSAVRTNDLDHEIFIFRIDKFGTSYICGRANVSFFFVGEGLTKEQLQSISAASVTLHRAARGIVATDRDVFLGDSITGGQGVAGSEIWASLVSLDFGTSNITNLGWAGTTALSSGGSLSAYGRTDGTELLEATRFFVMMGSNDLALFGSDRIADYKAMLIDIADKLTAEGAQVVICSIPYTTRTSSAPLLDWVDAALEAASEAGVIGVDCFRPMVDSGDPEQYLADNVHPNALGHQFIAATVLAALA